MQNNKKRKRQDYEIANFNVIVIPELFRCIGQFLWGRKGFYSLQANNIMYCRYRQVNKRWKQTVDRISYTIPLSINEKTIFQLPICLQPAHILFWCENKTMSPEVISILKQNTNLKTLVLEQLDTAPFSPDTHFLDDFTQLTYLKLNYCGEEQEYDNYYPIEKYSPEFYPSSLTRLHLESITFCHINAANVPNLTKLTILYFEKATFQGVFTRLNTIYITPHFQSSMYINAHPFPRLQTLKFTGVVPDQIDWNTFSRVQHLKLHCDTASREKILPLVPRLQILTLTYSFTLPDLNALSSLTNLKVLAFIASEYKRYIPNIPWQHLHSLRVLDLRRCWWHQLDVIRIHLPSYIRVLWPPANHTRKYQLTRMDRSCKADVFYDLDPN